MLLLNILLAVAWLLLTGQFTPLNFLFGLVISYAVLWFFGRAASTDADGRGRPAYFNSAPRLISFVCFFVWELILANLRVARDVLRPRMCFDPAVVAVPLPDYSDAEVTLLATFITLTPGTLSLDIVDEAAEGARTLYVHAMHVGSTQDAIDRFRTQLQQNLATRVEGVMRS
ncbi:MAG: Na+/H+ antiporter subunit E [Caldilineaceae bacterium]